MVTSVFSLNGSKHLVIGFWNIHGVRNKLETPHVKEWISLHDLLFLCETNTNNEFSVAGYKVLRGISKNPSRGGVSFLIKTWLWDKVVHVDILHEDQIWFELSVLPNIVIGGCYVPPADSLYYSESSFAYIQSKCINTHKQQIVIGDFNARLGPALKLLVQDKPMYTYIPVDPIKQPNSNGKKLLSLCNDCNLLIGNNLICGNKHLKGGLTYREKARWISELDLCLASESVMGTIHDLDINQSLHFPSDHAPVSMSIKYCPYTIANLSERALYLGDHAVLHTPTRKCTDRPCQKRVIRYYDVNHDIFQSKLQEYNSEEFDIDNAETSVSKFCDIMYTCAATSQKSGDEQKSAGQPQSINERWQVIMDSHDDRLLWKSINWKGELLQEHATQPSDEQFKTHLESITNPPDIPPLLRESYNTSTRIPILDDPFHPNEIDYVIEKQIKPCKSSGCDGLSPGLFKHLPLQWIITLTLLLSNIFKKGIYPGKWSYARLIMLFKKGDRMSCDNYRGISILNSIAKIYDYVLCNRLMKWFTPDREQAGAQPKRGCMEHIVTLRFIMNYCIKKKAKLFVAYVDFSKAYDRVPRDKLMYCLKNLGCGSTMLLTLVAAYQITGNILSTAIIATTVGVRQGSPTSCFLFTIYVNVLIKMFKDKCRNDGFLRWLHVLMLMDDTVIFATSRERLQEKLNILNDFCIMYGMKVNKDKTKFMVINGHENDRQPLMLGDNMIEHCNKYNYLGCIFTADGKTKSTVKEHVLDKMKHFNKLVMFLKTNKDLPFIAKKKVVEAAFNAALLYGCESWVGISCHAVNKLYLKAIKCLLGVRNTTLNEACLAELGLPPLYALVRHRQQQFFAKMTRDRAGMDDDPLMFAIDLVKSTDNKLRHYLNELLLDQDCISEAMTSLYNKLQNSRKTKHQLYCSINPNMIVHKVYKVYTQIPEYCRIAFSRVRLCSHRLRIETGRWARLPREERLCRCGLIQDEEHVLQYCPLVQGIREARQTTISFPDVLNEATSPEDFKFIHDIVSFFDN